MIEAFGFLVFMVALLILLCAAGALSWVLQWVTVTIDLSKEKSNE